MQLMEYPAGETIVVGNIGEWGTRCCDMAERLGAKVGRRLVGSLWVAGWCGQAGGAVAAACIDYLPTTGVKLSPLTLEWVGGAQRSGLQGPAGRLAEGAVWASVVFTKGKSSLFPLNDLLNIQVVDLKGEPGTSLSYGAIKEAVEAHKPAVLFLCQVANLPNLPLKSSRGLTRKALAVHTRGALP